jgi:predicted RNA methylase
MMDITAQYNRGDFVSFLSARFLPDDFETADDSETAQEKITPENPASYIKNTVKLGSCPSLDLSVYEFVHSSRHDPRVSLSREAFALLKHYDNTASNALAVFYNEDSAAWRLSLITSEYSVGKTSKQVKRGFSNPRRYSWLLGEGCKRHTPESMLFKGKVGTIDDLSSRFAIDAVTKKFYQEIYVWYKKCLDDIQIDLKAAGKTLNKSIEEELKPQAVIRVITRLMFIWFMKEKRLIKEMLFTREFAEQYLKNKDVFYNAILQNLFFAVLNKKVDDRRFRNQDKERYYDPDKNDYGISDVFRYKDFFKNGKADDFLEQTKTIPFVNGGLFVCHDYKFSGKDAVANKNNTAGNYIIDGFSDNARDRVKISDDVIFELIALFSRFAFTIEESMPTDQDIALDPELLGKVFENLLGAYNPETRENARKQTGSFYTPREIVDYMCKESLKEALKAKLPALSERIDDLIDRDEDQLNFPDKTKLLAIITGLKILDPACGSGAFPMGMFMLMTRTIEKLQEHKTTYKNKLDIIENCIYGVDIQNIAVEISKLRFFISLLVDYRVPDKVEDFDVLPNLETKFVVANTLIGIEKEDQNELFGLECGFKELTDIFLQFTTARTPMEKETIKNRFNLKKEEIVNNPNFHCGSDTKNKILTWNPFNVCYCSPFFDKQIMFGIADGFDIVIGNPPYGAGFSEKEKRYFLQNYESAKTIKGKQKGSTDTFALFIEKGHCLCILNGNVHLIVPIAITSSDSMTSIHALLEKTCSIIRISSYAVRPQPIFQNAVVNTSILFFKKDYKECEHIFTTKMYRKNDRFNLQYLLDNLEFIDAKNFKLNGRYPKISLDIEKQILEKVFSLPTRIHSLVKKSGKPIFYRTTGGRYFKVITNYSTGSTKEKTVCFDEKMVNVLGAVLSSNLYFWFYQIFSNNLDLKSYEIESFPVPLERISENTSKAIELAYSLYLTDIEKYANIRNTEKYANINSFKEYKIRKSKHLVDCIDDLICPLYGLTKLETEFIKNYEIEFRVDE